MRLSDGLLSDVARACLSTLILLPQPDDVVCTVANVSSSTRAADAVHACMLQLL